MNDTGIISLRDFKKIAENAGELKKTWDKELDEKKIEIGKLKETLNEYQSAFNFVGLYQGFESLGTQKKKEGRNLFISLIIMGMIILLPLLFEIGIAAFNLFKGNELSTDRLLLLIPIISVEIILIYFFRIILHNHRSIQVQKMQIELRQTLCQFIQSYAEYAVKMRKEKQGESVLEKFENLIFSGIIAEPEKLPSTYDGFEQIGNLIKSIKNPT